MGDSVHKIYKPRMGLVAATWVGARIGRSLFRIRAEPTRAFSERTAQLGAKKDRPS